MKALAFWKAVCVDEGNLLERVTQLLEDGAVEYCVIGGQAVNAYVEPLVSLDLDVVVATADLRQVSDLLRASGPDVKVETFPHSVNVGSTDSDLRIQFQTDTRYQKFLARAQRRDVLGLSLPVAVVEDVLQGKVWAAEDPGRRPSKRQKDLADIARLLEACPDLRHLVPATVLRQLVEG